MAYKRERRAVCASMVATDSKVTKWKKVRVVSASREREMMDIMF